MDTSKSEFYHFGILPQVCIHSLDEDEYSKMYIPKEKCDCGCADWIESTMQMFTGCDWPKPVHRCKKCNQVRTANHIGYKE